MSIRPGNFGEGRAIFQRGETESRPREGQESVIDAAASFDGLFVVGHNLRIEGEAKGEIQCDGTLTIAEGARVSAKVAAANVVIAGLLDGAITCRERLQILPSGRLSGTVSTSSLVIQEGALFEGELHMRASQEAAAAESEATYPTPSVSAGRGRPGAPNGRGTELSPADEV